MGLKNGEKKGILFYYNYRSEMEALSDRQKVNILFVLAELDETGEIDKERERFEELQTDPLAYTLFKVYTNQQNRASRAWHNINKANHKDLYDSDGRYITHKDFDEQTRGKKESPPAVLPPAEQDRQVEGIVMYVDMENGRLTLDDDEVFTFDVEYLGSELKDKVGRGISLLVNADNVIEDFSIE